jgi:transposase
VRNGSLWGRLVGADQAVVEEVRFDEANDALVVAVRPRKRSQGRCGVCEQSCPGYDQGEGPRRWRAMDLGTVRAYVEADAPRVRCPDHGVVVASVPWARHGAGHTRSFDDLVAWLATNTSKLAVCRLLRIAWRTVGAICERVVADARAGADPLDGLVRIGVDEISYRRGYKFLTVVVNHDTGRLVWATPGKSLESFFEALGPERRAGVRLVSADAADWIGPAVTRMLPNASLCLDPFHLVRWATRALDEVRKQVWRDARRAGTRRLANEAHRARFALWKNPADLSTRQTATLAKIAETNEPLYRAYLLKEQFRVIFTLRGTEAILLLDEWLTWARRSQLKPFVELARLIAKHRRGVEATLTHGLSNGLIESVNTRIRLITRVAFGFRSPEALIALAMLKTGGYCPSLPGRSLGLAHG